MPTVQLEPGPAWMLVEQLGASDASQRMAAVSRLRTLGVSAAQALEQGLRGHPRVHVRRWCAHLLAESGRRASACAIVAATHDRVAAVRLLALRALAEPSRQEEFALDPIPHLVRLARHDRSARVRRTAVEILTRRLPDARAVSVLGEAVGDPRTEPDLRRKCLRALDAAPPARRLTAR